MTVHARLRAAEMGVSTKLVKQAVREAELDYPSTEYPGCRVAVKGMLAVPYDPSTGEVITVLWHGATKRNGRRQGRKSDSACYRQ
jgi:hypothetical protein